MCKPSVEDHVALLHQNVPRSDNGSPIVKRSSDVDLEQQIKRRAEMPKGERLAGALPFLVVTFLCAFQAGLVFGWAPFATMLEAEGVYASKCPATEPSCDARIVGFSFIYSLGTAALAFGGLPVGILLDLPRFGPVFCSAMGGLLVGGGLLAIAFLPADALDGDAFVPAFVALGFGGILSFFTAMKAAAIFPKRKATILIAVSCSMHTSAIIPLIFFELMEHFSLRRSLVIGVYGALVLASFAIWTHLWRTFSKFLDTPSTSAPPSKPSEANGKAPTNGSHIALSRRKYGIQSVPPHTSTLEVLRSPQFVCGCVWFVCSQWHGNTYLGESKYMLAALGDKEGDYMQIFSIFLGTALLTLPVLSCAESKLGPTGQMQLVSILALVHALCALVPWLPGQIVTFAVFTLLRTSIYSTAGIFVASTFGFGRMGLVYGLMQFAGALSNLTIAPVASWILDDSGRDGDWTPLFCLWIALAVGQFAMIEWLARKV